MAIYRSMTAERVRQFAATLADGRGVATMANGTARSTANVVQQAIAAMSPVETVKAEIARRERVTDQEVANRQDWMRAACDYAAGYTGNFDYMVDMRNAIKRYGGLSIPQMRGTLNCLRAEGQRENAEQERKAAQEIANRTVIAAATAVKTLGEVLDGFYTVKFEDGSHVTMRINSLSAKQSRDGKPHRFASYLCGPINTSDYRRFAEIRGATYRSWGGFDKQRAALEILMSAGAKRQTAFGKAYAKAACRCYRCGKLLTEPESIESGIGPICAGRE